MQIDKYSEDFLSEARALRVQYIRSLLICGWNSLLGFFRAAGQVLMECVTYRRNQI
jgi:hypothetical protein